MIQDKTVTLVSFTDRLQAAMLIDKLEAAGIPAFLNDENVAGLDPVGGVEVKIFEKDIEAAKLIA